MSKNIILDTGFWYALYDKRDQYHEDAQLYSEYLTHHKLIIPWPTLYETLNTRFTRRHNWISGFKGFARKQATIIEDNEYKEKALNTVLQTNSTHPKYSLVDLVIREILSDYSIKIDTIITFNYRDFADICQKRNIVRFNG